MGAKPVLQDGVQVEPAGTFTQAETFPLLTEGGAEVQYLLPVCKKPPNCFFKKKKMQ